jgi:hypothetical protein
MGEIMQKYKYKLLDEGKIDEDTVMTAEIIKKHY